MLRSLLTRATTPLLCAGLLWTAAPAHAQNPERARPVSSHEWADRATTSYRALQKHLYEGARHHGLYLEHTPRQPADPEHSYLWPFREAAQAAVDMQALPHTGAAYRHDAAERFATAELYYTSGERPGYESYLPAPLGTGGDVYYDDNAVVALTQLDQYEATGDERFLKRAERVVPVVSRAWDDDTGKACPGGMDWYDSPNNNIRATNVTALSAQLAARLYEHTRDRAHLDKAEQWYGWVYSCMRKAPGLYVNDRGDDGSTNETLWTYNSGAMIGTATALYRGTGNAGYLQKAVEDARGSLAYWSTGDRLHDQPAVFNAFYFKDLLDLDALRPDPARLQAMSAYADGTYRTNLDASTGLFRFQPSNGGDYDPAAPAATLNQSAMVQIFATLAHATHQRS
ncbi:MULTISPECIES: glycoside hydrolase family 76 protein [unclassified Streptomyces]|uniref:glycoside hydrolase family 76 protein n=1 Tax=unclassified Streptomyces TaxID=2593676 RepID=UPI0025B3D488|nr:MULTISPECIES: glycoside hydrolase family 76 protein [unclassified Streptomyces]MDN3246008.1 glycoside hydrolase family 76 protein [Streptomyces sp. ZSW22]MDN3254266.1 glycoside hydrolase family 76 protein [Streptomyces sp. MA25(2023)]